MSVRYRFAFLAAALAAALGCGGLAPTTHEVKGKVALPQGDVKLLEGAHVEAQLFGDRRVEVTGEIQSDGSFTLGTIHAGKPLGGAPGGEYEVRIVLSDEDRGAKKRGNRVPLARRFTQYRTSGLKLQAPAAGEVVLQVSPR